MASIEKRRDRSGKYRYRVRIRRKGAPDISQSFSRLTDARAYAQRMEADIDSGQRIPIRRRQAHTLQEAVDRYLGSPTHAAKSHNTRRQGSQKLRWWASRLGHLRLSDISTPSIIELRDELGQSLTPGTVRVYVGWLRYLLNLAITEWEWLERSPMTRRAQPPPGEPRLRILSDDERERLLDACQKQDAYIYLQTVLALSTGGREMEIVGLQWRQVDFERRLVIFEATKTHERRSVALTSLAYDMMLAHADSRDDSEWVFPPRKPTRDGAPRFNHHRWDKVTAAAGLDDFHFHDLRHTAASYLAMRGATLLDIAHILGHKHISMTQRYAHLTTHHTAGILEDMNQSIFGDKEV